MIAVLRYPTPVPVPCQKIAGLSRASARHIFGGAPRPQGVPLAAQRN
jgi:hypothetical protein